MAKFLSHGIDFENGLTLSSLPTIFGKPELSLLGGLLRIDQAGPHVIGGATAPTDQLRITGSFGGALGLRILSTFNPPVNQNSVGLQVAPTMVEAASGTHPDFVSVELQPPTITPGAATITNASTLKITGAPTGAANNYALWVAAGDIRWGAPLVALGGGAVPTLGTIGGSGPTTAAQNTWMRVIDSSGVAFWVPAWK